ncbi:uncharacterized protein LOC134822075 [Bolinopsis microptera]|uniref:uncharacterized protein LOC134822075 n=1 Tax=Bolinopsis microptera TaxID=2820187 RepID=UPI0030796535
MVQLQVIDLLKTTCGPGCQSIRSCWRVRLPLPARPGVSDPNDLKKLQIGDICRSPNVIKANNPEVVAILGDEFCHLVCDLELDSLEEELWEITWYKMRPNGEWDESVMSKNSRYRLSEDNLALRIGNVIYEDRGIYKCEIVNVEGKYKRSRGEFNVIVIPQDCEDGRVRIRVEQTPICCKLGDRVNMAAIIENKPRKAKVDWFKMRGIEEVSPSRRKFKITHHKDVTQARIKSASTEDSGVYRIKVVSSGDYAIGHIVLNVNTANSEVEVEEMMKRAFAVVDHENSGLLLPSQVKETMSNLGLTVPNGCIDDVIYLAINPTSKLVHYNTFIDKIVYQYKSELGELT